MLRITTEQGEGDSIILKLEGQITAESASLLEEECRSHVEAGRTAQLDLAQVTYVDRCGTGTLRKLAKESVALINCSSLIQALIAGG